MTETPTPPPFGSEQSAPQFGSPSEAPQYGAAPGAPMPEAPKKKSWVKWVVGGCGCLLLVSLLIGGCSVLVISGSDDEDTDTKTSAPADPAPAGEEPAAETEEKAEDDVPSDHASALRSAETYSDMMHMSKQAIYDQLTSEYDQFSEEAAQYAIDNIDADWNENALESAKSYRDTLNMSPDAIHDQLTSEYGGKFTEEEADYAIEHLDD